ncbi:hypothetical protein PV326_007895 [Microctonus aethiopoides]|nr:hypothetical protein PV326_007895 [Microctonus aethiopoides]
MFQLALTSVLAELAMLTHTTGNEPTFMGFRRHKVVDFTICSAGLSSCPKNWRVSNSPSGSDHSQIRMILKGREVLSNFKDKKHLELTAVCFGEAEDASLERIAPRALRKDPRSKQRRIQATEKRKCLQRKYHKALVKARSKSWKHFYSDLMVATPGPKWRPWSYLWKNTFQNIKSQGLNREEPRPPATIISYGSEP